MTRTPPDVTGLYAWWQPDNLANLWRTASQRTNNLRLLIYGNLLSIHDPVRLAEELSMLDCLSNGRLISGFARGIPREHRTRGSYGHRHCPGDA